MPLKNHLGTRFLKNRLYKLAQKYKPNFYHREKEPVLQFWHFFLHSHAQIIVYIESMAKSNLTTVTKFILVGFTDYPCWKFPSS